MRLSKLTSTAVWMSVSCLTSVFLQPNPSFGAEQSDSECVTNLKENTGNSVTDNALKRVCRGYSNEIIARAVNLYNRYRRNDLERVAELAMRLPEGELLNCTLSLYEKPGYALDSIEQNISHCRDFSEEQRSCAWRIVNESHIRFPQAIEYCGGVHKDRVGCAENILKKFQNDISIEVAMNYCLKYEKEEVHVCAEYMVYDSGCYFTVSEAFEECAKNSRPKLTEDGHLPSCPTSH